MSDDLLRWPKASDLKDALDVVEKFREIAKFQLDLGYWTTVSFPSKYHLNKILSTQYIDKSLLVKTYGSGLVERLDADMPFIRAYLQFVGGRDEKN